MINPEEVSFDSYMEFIMSSKEIQMYLKLQGIIMSHKPSNETGISATKHNLYFVSRSNETFCDVNVYCIEVNDDLYRILMEHGPVSAKFWLHKQITGQDLLCSQKK